MRFEDCEDTPVFFNSKHEASTGFSSCWVRTIIFAVDTLPKVEVTNIRRVYHNGEHNAFTDLIRWKENSG